MDSIIANNLALVREKIGRAEIEAGVAPGTVTLVGVTKNRTVLEIENAICEGLTDIGENRKRNGKLDGTMSAILVTFMNLEATASTIRV